MDKVTYPLADDFAWQVLEALGQGVTIVDINGNFVYANPAYAHMVGRSPAQLRGITLFDLTHPADVITLQNARQQRLLGETTTYEARLLRPDGTIVYAHITGVPRYQHGQIIGSFTVVTDLTAQKRVEEALRDSESRYRSLVELSSEETYHTLELDDVFDRILANVGRVVPHTGAAIMLADDRIGHVVRVAGEFIHSSAALLVLQLRMNIDESLVLSYMKTTRQPLLIAITEAHPLWRKRPGLEWVRSYAAAPVCAQDQTLGFLHLFSETPGFFTPPDAERLQAFADQVAVALRNARLFDKTRQGSRRLALVNQLSMTMNLRLELEDVLQSAVDGLAQVIEGVEIGVALFDEQGEDIHIVATYPPLPEGKAIELGISAAQIAAMQYLESGQMLVVTDTDQEPLLDDVRSLLSRWFIRSVVMTPLIVRNEMIGCISYVSIAVPRQFNQEEQDFMRIVANLVATRIDLARILTAERRRRQEIEAVQRASLSLIASLDLQRVLNAILQALLDLVAATVAGISLYDDGRLTFELTRPATMLRQMPETSPYQRQLADLIAHTGTPTFIEDNYQHPLWAEMLLPNAPHYALAGLPLQIEAQIVGVLMVSYPGPHFFPESEKRILTLLAAQAAVAIQNARLHTQVQAYAQELEQRVSQRTAELEEERNRLQAILDAAGEAIYFTDAQNAIRYANPATQRITGYRPEELVGQPGELWHSRTPASIRAELEARLRQGQSWQGEVISQRQDGSLYYVNLMLNPLHTAAGELAGFVGVQRDISQIKELARLREAFVSQIGHELQTPLANLQVYLDLLERGRPEKQQAYLAVLRQTATRLRKLIKGFLELSRFTADATPVVLTPIDVSLLVADLAGAYATLAAERSIHLTYQLPPQRLLVLGEPAMLPRLLSQLIDNALEYSSAGDQVTLLAAAQLAAQPQEDQNWVTISVADTGPGIPVTELPHVFERFYRGEAAASYTIPGAGLGLTICDEIVRKLGGRIVVDSQPGAGSIFTVWLRAALSE